MSTAMSRNLLKKSLAFVKSGGSDGEKCRSNSPNVGKKKPEVVGVDKEHSNRRSETKSSTHFQQKKGSEDITSTESKMNTVCMYVSLMFYKLLQLFHLLRETSYTSPQDEG